ncbi:hypothetical protein AWQ21_06245 [Picosynechococcus sp. PCC 7003]|nr:hypothetical protein AWQ21_06245 [Picosynechococcus sp. PCC 7003]
MVAIALVGKGLKSIGLGALALASGVVIITLQQFRLDSLQQGTDLTPEIVERQAKTEAASLDLWQQLPTYGYDNLVSDWVFLRFLQYFGDDEARRLGDYRLSADYFEVIVDLDPWFKEGYYYLSGSSSLYAGTPDRTVELLNRGLAQMTPTVPDQSFYLWRMKAIDEHLFLGDIPAAIQSYKTAAAWAAYYDDPESHNAQQRSEASVAFLERDPRSIMARVTAWSSILGQARDVETQRRAIAELEAMGVIVRIDENGRPRFEVPPEILEAEKEAFQIEED